MMLEPVTPANGKWQGLTADKWRIKLNELIGVLYGDREVKIKPECGKGIVLTLGRSK